jgi:hypothetical protein
MPARSAEDRMIDRQDLRDAWQYVLLIAPAPVGALIGLRYAVEQSARARAATWLCSCGMEVMAGLNTAARTFAADPLGFLGKALSIFRRSGP